MPASAFFLHCKLFAIKNPAPISSKAPMAAPIPIPALAPAESPPSLLGSGNDVEVPLELEDEVELSDCDVELLVLVVCVPDVLEELEELDEGSTPSLGNRICTFGLSSGVQHAFVSPQHHLSLVAVPSQGVIVTVIDGSCPHS